jgi:glycosyltransferase involved in cell wall biosynthesis
MWLPATVESVLSQRGAFRIEYIVVTDPSTDDTVTMVQDYVTEVLSGKRKSNALGGIIMKHVELSGSGSMYAAITAGFHVASGDIYAWINADDIYEPGAFETMARVFTEYPTIDWCKGITSTIEEHGRRSREGFCRVYRPDWLKKGIYGQEAYFIEQDSVFWRAVLWNNIVTDFGGIPSNYRSAGDYWLWCQFAKHKELFVVNAKISCFRKRPGQLSKDVAKYKSEQRKVRPKRPEGSWRVRLFFASMARIGLWSEPLYLLLYPYVFPHHSTYLEPIRDHFEVRTMPSYRLKPD